MVKKALTIAGSDSSGGAGIQADLKTFSALGVYGMSVITSVTAQNTIGVIAVEDISVEGVSKQIDAIFSDIEVDAVKIGMVSNIKIIKKVVESIKKWNIKKIVLDPVMVSESGSILLQKDARSVLKRELIPLADLITPNLYEASLLLERSINTIKDMEMAAIDLKKLGCRSVMVKGGHLKSDSGKSMSQRAIDIYYDGKNIYRYEEDRVNTENTHGTGCTYSSAIVSYLAKGLKMEEAIGQAKKYITAVIKNSIDIGQGPGPTNHFYYFWRNNGSFNEMKSYEI